MWTPKVLLTQDIRCVLWDLGPPSTLTVCISHQLNLRRLWDGPPHIPITICRRERSIVWAIDTKISVGKNCLWQIQALPLFYDHRRYQNALESVGSPEKAQKCHLWPLLRGGWAFKLMTATCYQIGTPDMNLQCLRAKNEKHTLVVIKYSCVLFPNS